MALVQWVARKSDKSPVKVQLLLLLAFSNAFIALNDVLFCAIMLFTTVVTYYTALNIEKTHNKALFISALIILVLELGYFKYTNFFISSFANVLGRDSVTLNILLPLGISFYIFTSIAYIVDVYQQRYKAERNFVYVALLLAFFPKIIAGPIVRGNDFLPQLKNFRGISTNGLIEGVQIFVIGLFKKMVIADHLGVFCNDVFASPCAFDTWTSVLAVVSYSLQIYFDFAGYSDMAIGAAKMLGIEIKPNFNLPYLAKKPSEFWKRWHISLSSWLMDYLYIPLGGSRKGTGRTYCNLLIVMIISGLWHGAGWTFVLWGFLHGLYSCVYRLIDTGFEKKLSKPTNVIVNGVAMVLNFIIVSLLWVFFRAENVNDALVLITQCFYMHDGISQPFTWSFFAIIVMVIITLMSAKNSKMLKQKEVNDYYPIMNLRNLWPQVAFFFFVGLTVIMGYHGNTAFVYGKF